MASHYVMKKGRDNARRPAEVFVAFRGDQGGVHNAVHNSHSVHFISWALRSLGKFTCRCCQLPLWRRRGHLEPGHAADRRGRVLYLRGRQLGAGLVVGRRA
jgi:hypothetical protein